MKSISNYPSVSTEIFTICNNDSMESFDDPFEDTNSQTLSYRKHCNLDVQRLSFYERIHLTRIHYLTIPNSIRVATIALCLVWFLYNLKIILSDYKEYDTIVYLDYQMPSKSKPPAVTICSHSILRSFNDSLSEIHVESVMNSNHISKLVYKSEHLVNQLDMSITCKVALSTVVKKLEQINCTEWGPVLVSMQEGHKCFTFFSDIYGDAQKTMARKPHLTFNYDQSPGIFISMIGNFLNGEENGFENSQKDGKTNTGVYLSLHDPTILPNMYDLTYHKISKGYYTEFSFGKTIQKLQPPPYKTNCFPYEPEYVVQSKLELMSEMRDDNLAHYQSRGECFIYCMWRKLNLNRCANYYSIYSRQMIHNDKTVRAAHLLKKMIEKNKDQFNIDNRDNRHDFVESIKFCGQTNDSNHEYWSAKQQCLEACPDACQIETFNEQNIDKVKWVGDPRALVGIAWATQPVTQIEHRPKFDLTELLGTIGGHVHIWLGLSVVSALWFVLSVLQLDNHHPSFACCDLVHLRKFWFAR